MTQTNYRMIANAFAQAKVENTSAFEEVIKVMQIYPNFDPMKFVEVYENAIELKSKELNQLHTTSSIQKRMYDTI